MWILGTRLRGAPIVRTSSHLTPRSIWMAMSFSFSVLRVATSVLSRRRLHETQTDPDHQRHGPSAHKIRDCSRGAVDSTPEVPYSCAAGGDCQACAASPANHSRAGGDRQACAA